MGEINITGNVSGTIVNGDNNFVVNTNHGTIVYQAVAPRVQRRGVSPKPPRAPANFVGRKRELQQVDELIASARPTLVHGEDGLGKTSLLKQSANGASAKSQPDGVVFLEGLDEQGNLLAFEDLTQRLFNALFESEPPLKVDHASARTYLSNTHPLVLLNSVSLSPLSLDKLADLFPEAPILLGSESSASAGDYETMQLGPLTREESLSLLASRAKVEAQPALDGIASLLADIPAALITAANVIGQKGVKPSDALARMQAFQPTETNKTRAALERVYGLLFSTLTDEEADILVQTAAAPGLSVDRAWLEKARNGSAACKTLEAMELLQANSPRFRLMPGLRSFLLRGRDVKPERERLLAHLLREMESRWQDFDFVQTELGNLLGLFQWLNEEKRWSETAQLGRALDPYLTLSGQWSAWKTVLDALLAAALSMKDRALEGWVRHQLSVYFIGTKDKDRAAEYLNQAIKIRASLGDELGLAYSRHNLTFAAGAAISKGVSTSSSSRYALLAGGLIVAALAAYLFFDRGTPNGQKPAASLAASETEVVAPIYTETSSPLPSDTPSPIPTATETLTITLSPTEPPSPTPTFSLLTGTVNVRDQGAVACRYGPGWPYMYGFTLRQGYVMDVLGRIDDGSWILVSSAEDTQGKPCWMNATYMDLTGDVMSLEPLYPEKYTIPLTEGRFPNKFPEPQNIAVARQGDSVLISWTFFDVPKGDLHNPDTVRYLLEAWVCEQGKIVFRPDGLSGSSVRVKDEAGCSEPSYGLLYLAWKHGYIGPVKIAWPQSPTVTLTPSP